MPDDQTTDAFAQADDDTTDDSQDDTTTDDLGAGGKAALASERESRKAAEKAAKQAQAELEKVKRQHMGEQERAIAEARDEAKREALTAANERLLKAEVRAAAAGKLADPSIAVRLLDLSDFDVSDDGDVDAKALAKAIDGLVKQYPALAHKPTTGDGDGGARRAANGTDMNALIRSQMRR